jgi:COPII coat assembly protein SEC16
MEDLNTYSTASREEPDANRFGHWQPALRPETPLHSTQQLLQQPHSAVPPPAAIESTSNKSEAFSQDESQPLRDAMTVSDVPKPQLATTIKSGTPPAYAPSLQLASGTGEGDELEDDGDDERLDPAWGIKRMDTAQILASVKRTSSFPTFTATASDGISEEPVQQWQEEQALTDGTDSFQQSQNLMDDPSPSVQSKPEFSWEAHDDPEAEHFLQDDEPFLPETQGHSPEESRFEEGVPLIQQHDDSKPAPGSQSVHETSASFGAPDEEGEESAFFTNMNGNHQSYPVELTRKSTSAVLGALDMEQHTEAAEDDQSFFSNLKSEQVLHADPAQADAADPDAASRGVEDMWGAMAEDDDFLVEDPDDLLPDSEPSSPSSFDAALRQNDDLVSQPSTLTDPSQRPYPARQSSVQHYTPHQPSTNELSQLPAAPYNVGLSSPALGSMGTFQSHLQQQRPAAPQSTQSFVDQTGGYQSPYDLPIELSKPKKRPAVLQQPLTNKAVPPPPRSSSISGKDMQSPFAATTSAQPSPAYTRAASGTASAASRPAPTSSTSSFFEELPITSKPRTGSGGGRYTPQQGNSSVAPPPMVSSPPQAPPVRPIQQPIQQPVQPPPANPYGQYQLQAPERLDPFSSQPLQPAGPSAVPAMAPVSNRYSPAPGSGLTAPRTGPSPRYSPAPPTQVSAPSGPNRYASQPSSAPSPPTGPMPFQPRTSSPLVHHKLSMDESQSSGQMASVPVPSARYGGNQGTIMPPSQAYSPTAQFSPAKPAPPVHPPKRSQTQSPSKQRPPQQAQQSPQRQAGYRPASAHGHVAPLRPFTQSEVTPPRPEVRPRGVMEQFDFIQPTDETRMDPLERWKGAPVFRFGFGGTVVSTFPKHVPRYNAGAVKPQIKATVGDVLLRESKTVITGPKHIPTFPGPLRAKSKKKDLLVWINGFISDLEAAASSVYPSQSLPDPRKRHEEKILLWKTVKSMVEHDGALDSGEALRAVNAVLAPEVHAVDETTATQYGEDVSPSIYRPSGTEMKPDSVDPMAMETIRKLLLRGNRKEAVWHAVDNRLWSHAFVIGSTMPRDTWKQIVSEFVKQEVKSGNSNTESLSTLYEIFGGNSEDCVDQLVSPSARAGLQMVSRLESSGPTKNALEGLDKWRETLSLIINNRSHGDHQALLSLGRLLADYGRVEAAHICFLFSRSASNPVIVGGFDDLQASIVLLGADHRNSPFDFARDLDAIVLTEIYEFATLVLPGSAVTFMPHLSTYKLRHAALLSDEGSKVEAQAYCDALTATLKNTKVIATYTPAFLGELDDFSQRLKQIPMQASGGWMGKPNVEKISGSLLSKLSNFVAGDDSDADSKGSGREPAEAGPFANVSGTPALSRAASQSDIHFGYPTSTPQSMPTTMAGSRYAPNGLTSARSSSELARGRPSLDSQRSPPSTSYGQQSRTAAYDPVNMMQTRVASPPANPYQAFASPHPNPYQATPPQSSYMPETSSNYSPQKARMPVADPYAPESQPVQASYIPTPPPEQALPQTYQPEALTEPLIAEAGSVGQPMFGGYAAPELSTAFSADETQITGSDVVANEPYGYAPPEDTGYVPYVPEPDSPVESKPKKKSFIDDDGDYAPISRPEASQMDSKPSIDAGATGRKAANDAAADAAFRAAAEADAARDKERTVKPKGSGWLGGWWGGGKKPESLDAGSSKGGKEPTVHRAKLGESKMKLYYDKDLKKWVNPDNPDAAKSSPTPPPPRAVSGTPGTPGPPMSSGSMGPPPMRSVSAAPPMTSPSIALAGSGPPSRVGTPASGSSAPGIMPTLPPSVNASLNDGGLAPPSGPPSRPGTAMSNASSIDDLLGGGPPMGGKRGAKGAKAKKGRYVDVMAK